MNALSSALHGPYMIAMGVFVLGILIFVHELGHFLLAKWNGVGVVEFAIGFGKKIWSKRVGETRYSIGLIPFGGYVRMVGDDPKIVRASETIEEAVHDESEEPLDPEEQKLLQDRDRWFLAKGYFAKISIVLAGPLFNFIFAFILAVGSTYYYGKHVLVNEPVIGEPFPNLPAAQAGMKAGDRILTVNGEPVSNWEEMALKIRGSGGKELEFLIERKDPETSALSRETLRVTATSETGELALLEGKTTTDAKRFQIGITPLSVLETTTFSESLEIGARQIYYISKTTVLGLYGMVRGIISPKNIGGPMFIFQEAARNAKKGVEALISFMILLSVSLGVLNLLPIPILDGGHIMIFTIEALLGGSLSFSVQERANQIGMALLLLLMVFAVSNDLQRIFGLG